MNPAQLAELRRQSQAFMRAGYDGHNRRPQVTTAATLKARARRRRWHRIIDGWLRELAEARVL